MTRKTESKTVVLLGHGSKREEANNILKDLAEMLQEESGYPVYSSFLQFTTPTLENVIKEVAEDSTEEVTIIPVFLYPGVHLKEDIPEKLKELTEEYPKINFQLSEPIGADRRLIPILQDRANNPQQGE